MAYSYFVERVTGKRGIGKLLKNKAKKKKYEENMKCNNFLKTEESELRGIEKALKVSVILTTIIGSNNLNGTSDEVGEGDGTTITTATMERSPNCYSYNYYHYYYYRYRHLLSL